MGYKPNHKVVLFGGAGFIGHNLALKLVKAGVEVTVVDSLQVNSTGYYNSLHLTNANSELYISFIDERLRMLRAAGVRLEIADVRDYHIISRIIDSVRPDTVIHLAAVSHANRSNKDPFSTFDHSLRTLENVLDAIKNYKTHVIYFSSSMVYGNFDGDVVSEDRYCEPMGIYGALKFAGEKLVTAYNQVFDLPYTIIRPSALYGERCVSRRVGQSFIENAISGLDLQVNGDGSDSLDFTYIDDLTDGVCRCVSNENSINQIFNLTYGSARSLKDLASLVQGEFPNVKLKFKPRDGLMPERGTLDIQKARDLLGYEPQYSIDNGLLKYIQWYKKFHESNQILFKRH